MKNLNFINKESSFCKTIVCLTQPLLFNHFAKTNVTEFSETFSLAENSLSLEQKSLTLGKSGWVVGKKCGIQVKKTDLGTYIILVTYIIS